MESRSSNLEDIYVYKKAMELGEMVWEVVAPWNYFQKDTVGKQWVRSTDSIAANISEGFGRQGKPAFLLLRTRLFDGVPNLAAQSPQPETPQRNAIPENLTKTGIRTRCPEPLYQLYW